jgi:hypothetical protein
MTLHDRITAAIEKSEKASTAPWIKRDHRLGEEHGCIVQGQKPEGMAYNLEVLGDDYEGFGGDKQRALDVSFVADAHLNIALLKECHERLVEAERDAARYRFMAENDCTLEYCGYMSAALNDRDWTDLDKIIDAIAKEKQP